MRHHLSRYIRAGFAALAPLLMAGHATQAQCSPAIAAPPCPGITPPVCTAASHDRLIVRAERDVCGATLNRMGRPTASGFMPTVCARNDDDYRINAWGQADRCICRASGKKPGDKA